MVEVIEQLQAYDIPHTSYIEAIRHMRDKYGDMSTEAAYHMIQNLSGMSPTLNREELNDEYVSLVLLYLVQESIRASFNSNFVPGDIILPVACAKAEQYIQENPWAFVKPEEEEDEIDPITGKAKLKKGKKQELAIQLYQEHLAEGKDKIIQVFQDELDMSKAGARTYYYNMRKKFGDDNE